jgi:hypothetical protein
MQQPPLERLVALVRRDLRASDVRILEPGQEETAVVAPLASADAPPDGEAAVQTLRRDLPGGRVLVVSFANAVDDVDARARRLEMLIDSFRETLDASAATAATRAASRPPPGLSLHEELSALAERCEAVDALVIDARSPVVWGAADRERGSHPDTPPADVVRLDDHRPSDPDAPRDSRTMASLTPREALPPSPADRAISAVRALPAIHGLHKGGHLHHLVRGDDLGYLARSFAGIYVLIVVFEKPFDELGAERAIHQSLPSIERLVLALPPLDPTPMGGAAAIRRGRRR